MLRSKFYRIVFSKRQLNKKLSVIKIIIAKTKQQAEEEAKKFREYLKSCGESHSYCSKSWIIIN